MNDFSVRKIKELQTIWRALTSSKYAEQSKRTNLDENMKSESDGK